MNIQRKPFLITLRIIFILLTLSPITSHHSYAADPVAYNLKGQIITDQSKADIKIRMLDGDGVMLDVVKTDNDGHFNLDLSVMDSSTLKEVAKLTLNISDKSNNSKVVKVSEYISGFAQTVTLKPIIFP